MSGMVCTACHGTGWLDPDCEECEGAAWLPRGEDGDEPCPSCRRSEIECELCNGTGY